MVLWSGLLWWLALAALRLLQLVLLLFVAVAKNRRKHCNICRTLEKDDSGGLE